MAARSRRAGASRFARGLTVLPVMLAAGIMVLAGACGAEGSGDGLATADAVSPADEGAAADEGDDGGQTPVNGTAGNSPSGGPVSNPPTGSSDGGSGDLVDLAGPLELSGDLGVLETVTHRFEGRAGRELSVTVTAIDGGCGDDDPWDLNFSVIGPDGLEVGEAASARISGCEAYGPWQLVADGVHELRVFGGDGRSGGYRTQGSYDISVGLLERASIPVDLRSPLTLAGEISVALDSIDHGFTASPGQQVVVEVVSMNGSCDDADTWDLNVAVIGPDGVVVGEPVSARITGCRAYSPWPLSAAGTHQLRVYGGDGWSGGYRTTGAYELTVTLR